MNEASRCFMAPREEKPDTKRPPDGDHNRTWSTPSTESETCEYFRGIKRRRDLTAVILCGDETLPMPNLPHANDYANAYCRCEYFNHAKCPHQSISENTQGGEDV